MENPDYLIHLDDKSIVDFFVLQYFRTIKFGEEFKPAADIIIEKARKNEIDLEKVVKTRRVQDELQSIFLLSALTKLNYGPNNISFKEPFTGFNGFLEIAERLKSLVDECKKVIVISKSRNHFISSDNPAILKWVDKESQDFTIGYVPINIGVGIVFLNKKHHPIYNDPFQEIRLVDNEDNYQIIKNLNCLLTSESSRFLYAYDDRHYPYIKDYLDKKFPVNLIL